MKRLVLPFLGFVVGIANAANLPMTLNTPQDKLSYSMGYMTGKAMQSHAVSVNPQAFSAGLADGLSTEKPQMTEEQMQKFLSDFQKQQVNQMKSEYDKLGKENKTKGQSFLEENKKKNGVVTTASGLQYRVIEPGNGSNPTLDDTVTVNYEGRLLNGNVFDSSYKNGKPATFPLKQVIKGWQEALMLMKPGATWEIVIPAELAYGEQGAPGVIGPNEVLVFKVNLISVGGKKT